MSSNTSTAATEPSRTSSVVIYGPQGCGKTMHAEALREHFELDQVVDEWDGQSRFPHTGALVLTHNPNPDIKPGVRTLHFGAAMREMNGEARQV